MFALSAEIWIFIFHVDLKIIQSYILCNFFSLAASSIFRRLCFAMSSFLTWIVFISLGELIIFLLTHLINSLQNLNSLFVIL